MAEREWTYRQFAAAAHYEASMTLGEATAWRRGPGFACACVGGPWPAPRDTPCFCALASIQAQALRRAAHITARLVDDHRRASDPA